MKPQNPQQIFDEELERVKHNIAGGHITPRLASAMLEHFGRALYLTGANIDFHSACVGINPTHQEDMLAYRMSKPADLIDAKQETKAKVKITGLEVIGAVLITTLLLIDHFFPGRLQPYVKGFFDFVQKYSMELLLTSLIIVTAIVTVVYFSGQSKTRN